MGRHDRKHGRDAKAAVVHAYEAQGMTAAQVVTLAAAGKLKVPDTGRLLPAFTIAESTVKEYARLARRRLRATANGHENAEHEVALAVRDTAPAAQSDPWETHPVLRRLLGGCISHAR